MPRLYRDSPSDRLRRKPRRQRRRLQAASGSPLDEPDPGTPVGPAQRTGQCRRVSGFGAGELHYGRLDLGGWWHGEGIVLMRAPRLAKEHIRILVTGGTFDKEYDEIHGQLFFKQSHVPEMLALGRSKLDVNVQTLMMI